MSLNLFQMLLLSVVNLFPGVDSSEPVHIRVNQVGYLPVETKIAIAFSNVRVNEKFELISDASGSTVLIIKPRRNRSEGWGTFKYYYELDFSKFDQS